MTIRVVHTPWNAQNPYQRLMGEGMLSAGFEVEGVSASFRFGDLVPNAGVELLHFHWAHHWSCRPLARVCVRGPLLAARIRSFQKRGGRVFWTVHNLRNHEKKNKVRDWAVSCSLARLADGLFVHSEAAADAVQLAYSVASRKVHVVPHGNYVGCYPDSGTREEARSLLNIRPTARVVLFFGTIREYKGVQNLIRAFLAAKEPGWHLVIAGQPDPPSLRGEIESMVAGQESITFHPGFVSESDVWKYFKAADLVAMPYLDSLTSGAVVLAMSFGRAVLIPDNRFMAEMAGPAGIQYECCPRGLIEGLGCLRETESLSDRGEAGYLRALDWDWGGIGKRVGEIYLNV